MKTNLKGERAKLLFKNLITTDFAGVKIRGILNLNTDINQKPQIKFGESEEFSSYRLEGRNQFRET